MNTKNQFRCNFCGTTKPRWDEAYEIVLKTDNGVVHQQACIDCADRMAENPDFLAAQFVCYTDHELQHQQNELERQNKEDKEERKNLYLRRVTHPQMIKKTYGSRLFAGGVDLTDPYANEDDYVNRYYPLATGEYSCITWDLTQIINSRYGCLKYSTPDTIGIYLNGHVPAPDKMIFIYHLYNISGLVGFFDAKEGFSVSRHFEDVSKTDIPQVSICEHGFLADIVVDSCDIYVAIENYQIVAIEIRCRDYIPRGQ